MKENKYILAIDQGTSSTKSIIFDRYGKQLAKGSEPLHTHYFGNGFVEQEAEDIYANVLASVRKCLENFISLGGRKSEVKTIGISNQRETFVVWDKNGIPLHPAIVWQCKRSSEICAQLTQTSLSTIIQQKTGLIVDPYFSATKLIWLSRNSPRVKKAIAEGDAYFGTVDTWLLYKMTGGKNYFTDVTNASRTLLFNLHSLDWDNDLIDALGLKGVNLPKIKRSSSAFGETSLNGLLDTMVPVNALIGDSHAAAFGEGCFETGSAKATLGTGCSVLMNIGAKPLQSNNGMVTTICWSTEDMVSYALEGVIVSCGATVEWLKNDLNLFETSNVTEAMATSVKDNGGVYLVPAFSGLGSPHWQMNRRASISGLSLNTNKNHIVRAALESIPYQINDVIVAMQADSKILLRELMTDGGITSNRFVMQFLSNLLAKTVTCMGTPDVSALGAAYLAGMKAGIFENIDSLKALKQNEIVFEPLDKNAIQYYEGWKKAIGATSVE